MKTHVRHRYTILAAVTILGLPACRTTNESSSITLAKALDADFSPEAWEKSCQAELDNPEIGPAAREQLMQMAQTEDCKTAYPAVRKMVETYVRNAQQALDNKR